MDCNHSKRSDASWQRRPQKPTPPGMNTDCCCDANLQPPMRPAMRPNTQPPASSVKPPQLQIPSQSSGIQPVHPQKSMEKRCDSMRPGSMAGMPIGMGYVPWQRWGQTYPISQAFQRGTIFPELDLPFVMGRCRG